MLTDPAEIDIISNARQPNVRDPKRPREPFDKIFADFLGKVDFSGQNIIDLGPGQYDFCELVRDHGASECFAIDNDSAVVELGHYKKITVSEANLKDLIKNPFPDQTFNGVFCKYSFNCFWFHNSENDHRAFLDALVGLMKPDGWAWLAPWNGVSKAIADQLETIEATARIQHKIFIENGFTAYELTDDQSKKYGVHGSTFNRPVFTKNLPKVSGLEVILP